MTVLDEIIASVVVDLAERERLRPLARVQAAAAEAEVAKNPVAALRSGGLSVIAEIKRASPSKGALAAIDDPADLARCYDAGGATAISVLTEQRRFGGTLADLTAVRAAVATPLLRKDFVVSDYQVWEARAAGADLVLLIVAALEQQRLVELLELAGRIGLTALVEVHTRDEALRALDAGAVVVGVNNRDLKTLDVDLSAFERMAPVVVGRAVAVAESGMLSLDDAARMRSAGADAVLVGEMLVRHGDPTAAVAALRSLA